MEVNGRKAPVCLSHGDRHFLHIRLGEKKGRERGGSPGRVMSHADEKRGGRKERPGGGGRGTGSSKELEGPRVGGKNWGGKREGLNLSLMMGNPEEANWEKKGKKKESFPSSLGRFKMYQKKKGLRNVGAIVHRQQKQKGLGPRTFTRLYFFKPTGKTGRGGGHLRPEKRGKKPWETPTALAILTLNPEVGVG